MPLPNAGAEPADTPEDDTIPLPPDPEQDNIPPDDEEQGKRKRPSAATVLVNMAMDAYTLGVSETDEPFAINPDRPHIALPLRAGKAGLRADLANRYYDATDTAPGAQALVDALTVLEGKAVRMDPQTLNLRVAEHDGAIYIDCGNADGAVIKISGGAWTIVNTAPVLFRRTRLTMAMEVPAVNQGADAIDRLWNYARVTEEDRPLIKAWLVSTLIQPGTPHPIPQLYGEQGTAKSFSTKALVSLIDPSPVPVRKAPSNADEWVAAAAASWVVAIDNMSSIPDWLSDSLCRAATGDGNVRRMLFTDGDVAVWSFLRCVVINGISFGGIRGDLAERLLSAELLTIDPTDRRNEADLAAELAADRPIILGGLLDLAAQVHAMLPSVTLTESPRMADFAKVLHAIDVITGTDGLRRYASTAHRLAAETLADDPFTAAIIEYAYSCTGDGAKVIYDDIKDLVADEDQSEKSKWRAPEGWPKSARATSDLLTRCAPSFRLLGWRISNDRGRNKSKTKLWTITPPPPIDNTVCELKPENATPNPLNPPSQVNGHKSGGSEKNANPPGGLPDPPGGLPDPPGGLAENPDPPKKHALTRASRQGGSDGQKSGSSSHNGIKKTGNSKPNCVTCLKPVTSGQTNSYGKPEHLGCQQVPAW
jgi:hypothetical protein